ncbi:MAG: hypothetical protein RL662_2513 [Bacteroidota bacterium]
MKLVKAIGCFAFASLLFSCSSEGVGDTTGSTPNTSENVSLVNQSGETDGVKYTLKDVSITKNLLALDTNNSKLLSTDSDLQKGVFKLNITSAALTSKAVAGNILYILSEKENYARVIKTVKQLNEQTYEFTTDQAYLGDIIEDGSLDLSVDMQKAEDVMIRKNAVLRASTLDSTFSFNALNFVKEVKLGDLSFNPNASTRSFFNVRLAFNKTSKILPSELIFTYETKSVFNPYLAINKGVNKTYTFDMIDNVPTQIIDLIKKVEIDFEIPAGSLGKIPAKLSVDEISIPSQIIANTLNTTSIQYFLGGSLKVGYAYYNNESGKTSHPIYENTLGMVKTPDIKLNGEIGTDMKMIITPKITLVSTDLLKATGKIAYGLETFTSASQEGDKLFMGSKGTSTSYGVVNIYSLGVAIISSEILNNKKEIWNIGEFNNKITFSNFKMAKATKTPCSVLSYSYPMALDYSYPIANKTITGDLEISYDVYDDSNKLLAGGRKTTITPIQLSDKSFRFDLCLPFKADALAWKVGFMRPLSYVKNIVIKDNKGNVGSVADFAVGSPYNTSFWK